MKALTPTEAVPLHTIVSYSSGPRHASVHTPLQTVHGECGAREKIKGKPRERAEMAFSQTAEVARSLPSGDSGSRVKKGITAWCPVGPVAAREPAKRWLAPSWPDVAHPGLWGHANQEAVVALARDVSAPCLGLVGWGSGEGRVQGGLWAIRTVGGSVFCA